jgi:hypothetical protein
MKKPYRFLLMATCGLFGPLLLGLGAFSALIHLFGVGHYRLENAFHVALWVSGWLVPCVCAFGAARLMRYDLRSLLVWVPLAITLMILKIWLHCHPECAGAIVHWH